MESGKDGGRKEWMEKRERRKDKGETMERGKDEERKG